MRRCCGSRAVVDEVGELVITKPMPSLPRRVPDEVAALPETPDAFDWFVRWAQDAAAATR